MKIRINKQELDIIITSLIVLWVEVEELLLDENYAVQDTYTTEKEHINRLIEKLIEMRV